jgi:hypothetical protein
MSRDKENYARIEALAELLVAEGVIKREQADAILNSRDFEELHERAKEAKRETGPPDFAGNPGQGNRPGGK